MHFWGHSIVVELLYFAMALGTVVAGEVLMCYIASKLGGGILQTI